jgi:UDP-glucose 4-epimerase
MSVREVIETVGAVAGRTVPFTMGPRRPGDPARLVASNALAKRVLGWQPALGDLRTIVETAWRWHRTHPQGYTGAQQ